MAMQIINTGYLSTNYYILCNPGVMLLIDAGWPGTFQQFKHVLQKKDIRAEEINYLLITHYHPDHAGLVQEIKDIGTKLIVIEEQLPAIPLFKNYIKPGVHYKPINPDDNIVLSTAGSRGFLKKLGFDGEIIHTPGHSDDSVTLVLDSGEAFTGDLPPENFSDNPFLSESWKKLKALGASKIYPGHGGITTVA